MARLIVIVGRGEYPAPAVALLPPIDATPPLFELFLLNVKSFAWSIVAPLCPLDILPVILYL